jgi:hypothetical protein
MWFRVTVNQIRLDSLIFGRVAQQQTYEEIEEWESLEECEESVKRRYSLTSTDCEYDIFIEMTMSVPFSVRDWILGEFDSFFLKKDR